MQHLVSNIIKTKIEQSRTAYLEVLLLRDKRHSLFVARMSWHIRCPLKEVKAELLHPLLILCDVFH